jgi:hypothetical protein
MKRLIGFLLICLIIPSWACADDTVRRQLAEELLSLNNIRTQVDQMHIQINRIMMSQLDGLELPESAEVKLEEIQKLTTDILSEDLSWDKLKDEYIDLYAATFDEEELKGIIEFTRSPLGQKLNEKTPVLMKKSMAIGQKHAEAVMPKIQAAIQEFMAKNPPQ